MLPAEVGQRVEKAAEKTKVEIEMRYRNQSLPVEQRVEDVLSRMDLAEKLAQLRNYCVNAPEAAALINGQVVLRDDFRALLTGTGVGSLQCLTRCDFWTRRTRGDGFGRRECAHIVNEVQRHAIEHGRWGNVHIAGASVSRVSANVTAFLVPTGRTTCRIQCNKRVKQGSTAASRGRWTPGVPLR